jgi:hypothetical protein
MHFEAVFYCQLDCYYQSNWQIHIANFLFAEDWSVLNCINYLQNGFLHLPLSKLNFT